MDTMNILLVGGRFDGKTINLDMNSSMINIPVPLPLSKEELTRDYVDLNENILPSIRYAVYERVFDFNNNASYHFKEEITNKWVDGDYVEIKHGKEPANG